jgi:hypothetical protein
MDRTINDIVSLKRAQEILYRLIVAPGGAAEGLAHEAALPTDGLVTLIAEDDRMTAVERVDIYANGYFYRLLDVLKEDYPAMLAVVGAENFHNLATGYLVDYPPTEPSIYYAGSNLAAYLSTHPLRERWPFLADLAALERAILESFHSADALALDADALRTTAPADWPSLVMHAHPATRLVDCAWRVDEVLRAIEDAAAAMMAPPASGGVKDSAATTMVPPAQQGAAKTRIAPPAPQGAGGAILVWRRETRVAYRVAGRGEAEALRLALAAPSGAPFAVICDAIAASLATAEDAALDEDVAAAINCMLARWLADGLFMRSAE